MNLAFREKKIINVFLVFCLASAFACFALVALPKQLQKARALPIFPKMNPANISAIVPLGASEPSAKDGNAKNVARFVPDEAPPSPYGSTAPREMPKAFGEEPAAGPGAAIDDRSAEANLAYSYNRPDSPVPNLEAKDGLSSARMPSSAEFKRFPASSLARREPSALMNPKSLEKKPWLVTPAGLENDVAFWKDVYGRYDRNQSVLHHPRYLNIIYDIVDMTDIENDPRLADIEKGHLREKRVEGRKKEITEILLKLSTSPQASTLTDEEWRIKKLFQGLTEADMFKRAAVEDGVRSQTGQKDKFIAGLKISGRYLGEIESIFELYGLPRELTRLIFVESMFNPHAVSSAGAGGIWQFMRATGKLFMQINALVDERNDPIKATHAAAKLMRQNYEALNSWPLAINAYNAGRGRMQQASTALGTSDIGRIIKDFDHPSYGFASRNFFLEFLAALDVAEHSEKYFGPIEFDPPLAFETVRTNYNISLPDVARIAGIAPDTLLELNAEFSDKVADGRKLVPMGFSVRVPEKMSQAFLAAAVRAPNSKTGPVNHVVDDKETLVSIAELYGVSEREIMKSNKLAGRRLRAGQTITVPVGMKR